MTREQSVGPVGGPPPGVGGRLAALRLLYAPEPVATATARLASERPADQQAFEVAVARRLRELRSLMDLAGYLHRALHPPTGGGGFRRV